MTTRTFRFTVAASGAPAWFTGLTAGQWAVLSGAGNVLNVMSVPYAGTQLFSAWNGGCVDQTRRSLVIAASGGHSAGLVDGNAVFALDLGSETPAWTRQSNSSTAGLAADALDAFNYSCALTDRTPVTIHHYNNPVADGAGRIWLPVMSAPQISTGYDSSARFYWDRNNKANATNGWIEVGLAISRETIAASYPGVGGLGINASSVYDPVDNRIYVVNNANNSFTNYFYDATNPAAVTISEQYSPSWPLSSWAVNIPTPGRRAIVVGSTGYYGSAKGIRVIDPLNPTAGYLPYFMNEVNVGKVADYYAVGAVFHASANSGNGAIYLYNNDGKTVWKLAIPSDPLTGSYTWSSYTPSGGVTPVGPSLASNLYPVTYGRFNIVNDMGNGESCLVLVNSIVGSTYVMRLPAGGL